MKDKKKLITRIVSFVVMGVIAIALIIGNIICGAYSNIITQYLCGFGLSEDSEETKAARDQGMALAAKVEEQGAVMLKNDGTLPLKNNKVNVFGYAGTDNGFIPQGTGSGTGSRNDYVTFLGGLKEAGFEYNEQLIKDYNALGWKRVDSGNFVFEATDENSYTYYYGALEAGESFYTDARMNDARNYSDTAVVVLGRLMGEGNDYSKYQYVRNSGKDETRKLQSLSENEEFMLDKVCEKFDNVVVIFNTTNPMEAGFLENDRIGAAIFMGMPGTRGSIGIANILKGKANPSGHLTDTWAYDLSTAASYATSGREGVGSYTDISTDVTLGTRANKYSDYAEDIYIGYKWYETADADGFWDSNMAKLTWNIVNGYDDVVQFPFGYGLSYTKFKWTVMECNLSDGATLEKDGKIEIKVAVQNVGDVAGMDVVQLYYTPPYTKGGIEKSAVNLGAFAKTALLQPDQIEYVDLTLSVEDMKSYDCYDRNGNGFMGYELEGGNYTISLRTDAHTLAQTANADGKNSYSFKVPESGYKYTTDSVTGNVVENQFTNFTAPSGASSTVNERAVRNAHSIDGNDEPVKINYMTRADFENTFPYQKAENRLAGAVKTDTLYVNVNPVNDASDEAPAFGQASDLTLKDVIGLDYDENEDKWNELTSKLTLNECANLVVIGGFGTIEVSKIGMPRTVASDGPAGFNNTVTGDGNLKAVCYPSATIIGSTWDWYMGYQVGRAIGIEGKALGISGWYGPGANLHRSVMGGRNFEYYSEDARLSGIICAYEVYGAKEQGLTSYVKHIAVNDSDSGRNGAYKWLTEQNLRENYLLPFELIVKVGKGNGMMSSVDRIGSTRAASSYALLTAVLRDEWGFRGTVITDYYQNSHQSAPGIWAPSQAGDTVHDVDECVRAGNDMLLWTDGNINFFNDADSNTAKKAIHQSAKNIIYTYADTVHFAETAQGLDKGSMIGESVEVFAWWIPVLVVADVVVAGLLVTWGLLLFKKKKVREEISDDDSAAD
ncbi:MAG: hypothetical protein HFE42_01120 [Clostridia bacterium]|nr:hypothetical protein [Clostridia bacterium]